MVSHYQLLVTPCCASQVRHNIGCGGVVSDPECWTDGYVKELSLEYSGICQCPVCAAYYLITDEQSLGTRPAPKPRAPADWETIELPPYLRIVGKTSRETMEAQYDTRPESEIKDEMPPERRRLLMRDMAPVIAASTDIEILRVARRKHWHWLNNEYRSLYIDRVRANFDDIPLYQPTTEQTENIAELAKLLEMQPDAKPLELAELYRELGNFDEAQRYLTLAEQQYPGRVTFARELIAAGLRAPVLFEDIPGTEGHELTRQRVRLKPSAAWS